MICRCRWCNGKYEESKSPADLKGYCKQGCMKAMAKHLGCKKTSDWQAMYEILNRNKETGSVPAPTKDTAAATE